MNSIISERRPQRVHVLYFDTQVHCVPLLQIIIG